MATAGGPATDRRRRWPNAERVVCSITGGERVTCFVRHPVTKLREAIRHLLKQIRKIGGVSEGIQHMVDEALEKRNYLIHNFFRSQNLQMNSEDGRKEMIADLRAIHTSLSRAHAVLAGMTHTFNQAFGRPNISEREAEELMRSGRRMDI